MRQLESLLFALGPSERAKIRPLQFRGIKRKIFFQLLTCKTTEGLVTAKRRIESMLSGRNGSAIYSEMLRSCYGDLVPEGGIHLLLYLGNKQLFSHFMNELRSQERQASSNTRQLQHFYEQVLIMRHILLIDSKRGQRISKALDEIAEKYCAMAPAGTDVKALGRILELIEEIDLVTKQRYEPKKLLRCVKALEGEIIKIGHPENKLALFFASDCLRQLYLIDRSFSQRSSHHSAVILKLLEDPMFSLAGPYLRMYCMFFTPVGIVNLSIKEVQTYLKTTTKQYGLSVFDAGVFLPRLLLAKEEAWARRFIADYFPKAIDLLPREAQLSYSFILLLEATCSGRLEEASGHLRTAFVHSRSVRSSSSTELLLRGFEIYLAIMQGDLAFADAVADRNIRYARMYGHNAGERSSMIFLRSVVSLLKALPHDTAKAQKIRERFHSKAVTSIFRFLFDKLYEKYFSA